MNALVHLVANLLIGSVLYLVGVVDSLGLFVLFVLFGVFIDVDHLLFLFFTERTFSLKRIIPVWKRYRRKMQANLYIFHSPEFNLIVLVLAFFYPVFLLLLVSQIVHLSLDAIEHYRYHRSMGWIRKWSVFYSVV